MDERPGNGAGRFLRRDGQATGVRCHRADRLSETAQHGIVVTVALGENLHQRATVLGDPIAGDFGRQRLARHRFGLQRRADLVEHRAERSDEEGGGLVTCRLRRLGQPIEGGGEAERGGCCRIVAACRHRAKLLRYAGKRRRIGGVARWRGEVERVDRRIEQQRGILHDGQLGVLIGGDETVDRHRLRDLGQRGKLRGQRARGLRVGGQHVDRVGRAQRIAHQVHQRAHRRAVLGAQMQRVEVELHERQQRNAPRHRQAERPQYGLAMRTEPAIERCCLAETHFAPRRAGLEQHQRGGQHGHARDQRHDHPEPGDDAEFGDANIIGRQKCPEAEEYRPRRQRQRCPERDRRAFERRSGRRAIEPLGVEAHRDLNPEIDAEPDEQRNEGDRNEVESADRCQPECRRHHQTGHDRHHDRRDDLRRSRREPQSHQHRRRHHQPDKADIFLQRREFLVRQWDFAGGPHGDAVGGIKAQRLGLRGDCTDRILARLQCAIIELGLREDQAAARRGSSRAGFGEQLLPGEIGGLALSRSIERIGHRPHRAIDPRERNVAALDPCQHRRKGIRDAAQRRIARQRAEQRLRVDQRLGRGAHLGGRSEQQPLAIEERTAIGALYAAEMRGVGGERGGELDGRRLGQLGRLAVDHHQQHVAQLREGDFDRFLILAPLDLGRDQRGGIGGHREMAGGKQHRARH